MDFDDIFEQYFDKIYYKILGNVKNPEDAEDIAQDTFMSVYKNLKNFRSDSGIYTWIYKIAINKIYDFYRKRKLNLELNDEILDMDDGVDPNNNIILKERLSKLKGAEKEVVLLKDIYGYKLQEIATMKNMNLSTVKSVYYKALKDMEV
ncbi:MAG: RNA polymerase sigma factor [Fusobacteriaceae bacterium]